VATGGRGSSWPPIRGLVPHPGQSVVLYLHGDPRALALGLWARPARLQSPPGDRVLSPFREAHLGLPPGASCPTLARVWCFTFTVTSALWPFGSGTALRGSEPPPPLGQNSVPLHVKDEGLPVPDITPWAACRLRAPRMDGSCVAAARRAPSHGGSSGRVGAWPAARCHTRSMRRRLPSVRARLRPLPTRLLGPEPG
jgi:hypothetical protein